MEGILSCKKCKKQYDGDKNAPVALMCGHSLCKACYLLCYQIEGHKILCPFDEKLFPASNEIPYNYLIIELMQQKIPTIQPKCSISCAEHEDKEAEFYCKKHDILLCSLCVWEHSDHKYAASICSQKEINQYIKLLREYLNKMFDSFECEFSKGYEMLDNIQKSQGQISSKDISNAFGFASSLLTQPYFKTKEEINSLKFVVPNKHSFLEESILAQNDEEKELFVEWLNGKYSAATLLYRATRDGFSAQTFHSKCDNKGPHLVLAQSTLNKVFGGYTLVGFNSKENYVPDNSAFIFSLSMKKKLSTQVYAEYAIYDHSTRLPTFGGGHDIGLMSEGNNSKSSYSGLGHTYTPPDGLSYNSNETQVYLAGEYYFQLKEVEVFQLHE